MAHLRFPLKLTLCIPALIALAACQSMGGEMNQRTFVAAHIVSPNTPASEGPIYIAQWAAFAQAEPPRPTRVADASSGF